MLFSYFILISFEKTKGTTQFRFSSTIDEIIDRTRVLLNTESVYKNQAIEINSDFEPKVMNLSNIDKEFMVLSENTKYELQPLESRIDGTSVL